MIQNISAIIQVSYTGFIFLSNAFWEFSECIETLYMKASLSEMASDKPIRLISMHYNHALYDKQK